MKSLLLRSLFLLIFFIPCLGFSQNYQTEEVVIQESRIDLKQEATQVIPIEQKTANSRPSLESALQGQSNIQITPTPLRGSNLSLNGLNGEHVAVYSDGDPILGRVDGSLNTRSVSLGTSEKIVVYQGLDSLPYGSQNIAGVIQMETPWEPEPMTQLRSAGGNYGRSLFAGKHSGKTQDDFHYSASVNQWRSQAIWNGAAGTTDTSVDSTAQLSAALAASKSNFRMGMNGFHENTKGVFTGELTQNTSQRYQVFSDFRRGKSLFHFSYTGYRNAFEGLGTSGATSRKDVFKESAFRIGPQLQESFGNFIFLAGSIGELHTTHSSRIASGKDTTTTVGSYLGARYVFNEHWIAGLGTRWDSSPRVFSPRAEVRFSTPLGNTEQTTVLESGLGFREVTPKEKFLDFSNPALHYRVLGNPDLLTERGWLTTLRHSVSTKKITARASLFHVRIRNAIGFEPQSGSASSGAVLKYSNISQTQTYGLQVGSELQLPTDLQAFSSYQWLSGKNLENGSELFLQPSHRITFGLTRNLYKGFTFLTQATWTGSQGFSDLNRNRAIDGEDRVSPFWSTSLELGYSFNFSEFTKLVRVSGRMDNALNFVRKESLPTEPRTFLVGATVEI